jgi:hypothetical protein
MMFPLFLPSAGFSSSIYEHLFLINNRFGGISNTAWFLSQGRISIKKADAPGFRGVSANGFSIWARGFISSSDAPLDFPAMQFRESCAGIAKNPYILL